MKTVGSLVALAATALVLAGCLPAPAPDARPTEAGRPVAPSATQMASVAVPAEGLRASPTPDPYGRVPQRGKYSHSYELYEEYEQASDVTRVYLYPRTEETWERPGIGGFYRYQGTAPESWPSVTLMLVSASERWQYADCRRIAWILDGTTTLEYDALHDGDTSSGYFAERIGTIFTPTEFLQVVTASQIEVRLCATEFKLTASEREALRDLASRMRPRLPGGAQYSLAVPGMANVS